MNDVDVRPFAIVLCLCIVIVRKSLPRTFLDILRCNLFSHSNDIPRFVYFIHHEMAEKKKVERKKLLFSSLQYLLLC
jgi:hypothetical protein